LDFGIYVERHHIIPKCLNGTDDVDNIITLTPEEHYVAHQLLVKMYPEHDGLLWAAIQMTGPITLRSNNKLYGWLKRKYQAVAKARTGNNNGSYGRYWYHCPETLNSVKCLPSEVPEGYIKGRHLKPYTRCQICNESTGSKLAKYCNIHRTEARTKTITNNLKKMLQSENACQRKCTDSEIVDSLKNNDLDIDCAMRELGYKVPQTGYTLKRFKKLRASIPCGF